MPSSYIILGATGSGRREVLCDLIRSTRADRTGVNAIYISEDERSSPHEEALRALDNTTLLFWRFQGDAEIVSDSIPNDTDIAFFVFDGLRSPVDQIEALKPWLERNNLSLARILSVVHCRLAFENPALAKWYEACIHFSDYVLLNRRTGVPNRWMREFQDYYKKRVYSRICGWVTSLTRGNRVGEHKEKSGRCPESRSSTAGGAGRCFLCIWD